MRMPPIFCEPPFPVPPELWPPRRAGALVGLARVISDGATICFLQDVLVHPAAQRAGIGRRRVKAALQPYVSIRQSAPRGGGPTR